MLTVYDLLIIPILIGNILTNKSGKFETPKFHMRLLQDHSILKNSLQLPVKVSQGSFARGEQNHSGTLRFCSILLPHFKYWRRGVQPFYLCHHLHLIQLQSFCHQKKQIILFQNSGSFVACRLDTSILEDTPNILWFKLNGVQLCYTFYSDHLL